MVTTRLPSAEPQQAAAAQPTRRRRVSLVLTGLVALLIVTGLAGIGSGAVGITPGQVCAILAAHIGIALPWSYDTRQETVLMAIRLLRVLLGALIGATLATTGAALQGLFRNPLADPGLLGISSGSALGATSVIVLGGTLLCCWLGSPSMPWRVQRPGCSPLSRRTINCVTLPFGVWAV